MGRHFTFVPDQHDVPVELVEILDSRARALSLPMVLIGAAARDLCVHAPVAERPSRSTADVDIAIAVPHGEAFAEFTSGFDAVHGAERKFAVIDVLDDPTAFARLALQMKHLTSSELLDAYGRGFAAGVPKGA